MRFYFLLGGSSALSAGAMAQVRKTAELHNPIQEIHKHLQGCQRFALICVVEDVAWRA
jgi:hypothetical protein